MGQSGSAILDYMEAGGHRLEYKWIEPASTTGAAQRAALVLLHEGLGSASFWKDFPDRLVQATGCAALIYSRHGYGKSEILREPRGIDYMHREAKETLPELLTRRSIREPILIGHSDGASIALIYAGARRGPVRGLVLMAPHVFVEDTTVSSIAQAKATFESTDLARKLSRYHDDAASMFYGWNDIWLRPEFRAWNIEEYLAAITCPILLIQGEDDQYGTRAQVDAIARQVGGPVELVMLSQCGHAPHVDRVQATSDAIAAFVDRIK